MSEVFALPRTSADPARARTLLDLLGRPEESAPLVLVAGGPGKTSVVRILTALLGAFGVKVGSYTLPHLQQTNERIRIAGEPVTDDELRELERYLEPFIAEASVRFAAPVAQGEALLSAALTACADAPVDAIIVEIGAAETPAVLQTDLLVMPSRGHDLSGSVRQALRAGGTFVLSDDYTQLASEVTDHASAVRLLGTDFGATVDAHAVGGKQLMLYGPGYSLRELYLPLHGPHQVRNASGAMAAAAAFLSGLETLDDELVRTGLASVRVPGRMEVVRRRGAATVVLDAAASAHALHCLAATLQLEFGFRHRMLVLAEWPEEPETLVSFLGPLVDHVVLLDHGDGDGNVGAAFNTYGVSVERAPDVASALAAAQGLTVEPDGIIVLGPDHVLGAVRAELGLPPA